VAGLLKDKSFKLWYAMQGLLLLCTITGLSESASALPSYARQTGHPCVKCHVGGFGPQLTPYGVRFKISAYTESDHKGLKIPIAGFVMASFTHTQADQTSPPTPYTDVNNNTTLDQVSGFLAGRITEDFGTFLQVTYNGNSKGMSIDNTDLRLAHDFVIGGTDAILGLSLNNNPGVQDPGNTLTAWNFPYISSAIAFGAGDTKTLINGGLAASTIRSMPRSAPTARCRRRCRSSSAWAPATTSGGSIRAPCTGA
jgi:hypothetical protein